MEMTEKLICLIIRASFAQLASI